MHPIESFGCTLGTHLYILFSLHPNLSLSKFGKKEMGVGVGSSIKTASFFSKKGVGFRSPPRSGFPPPPIYSDGFSRRICDNMLVYNVLSQAMVSSLEGGLLHSLTTEGMSGVSSPVTT